MSTLHSDGMMENLMSWCLLSQKQVDKLKLVLEKPDVISALNNVGSGNSKKSNQLTWNNVFHVSKISSYFLQFVCCWFVVMLLECVFEKC